MGGLLSFGYYLLREPILYCFTDLPDVLAAAYEYDIYIVFFFLHCRTWHRLLWNFQWCAYNSSYLLFYVAHSDSVSDI